jgi:hypothetical protein
VGGSPHYFLSDAVSGNILHKEEGSLLIVAIEFVCLITRHIKLLLSGCVVPLGWFSRKNVRFVGKSVEYVYHHKDLGIIWPLR